MKNIKEIADKFFEEQEKLNISYDSREAFIEGFKLAKEMEKEQRGYTESDMRSYASYILNNPVIEPSEWYKIYRTKSE